MKYLGVLVLIAAAIAIIETVHKLGRAVTRCDSHEAIIENAVTPWMLRGFNGTRAIAFNVASGIMIQGVKSLKPAWSLKGEVELKVLKTHVRREDCAKFEIAVGKKMKGRDAAALWRWSMPSPEKVTVLSSVSCNASILACLDAFSDLLRDVSRESGCRVFYTWCERGTSTYVAGRFE